VQPETRYAWLGPDRIAYQVLGQGPPDLVATPGSLTHVDTMWEDPAAALMYRRFTAFSRLIRFDRLGTGASDPAPLDHLPPWESYAEELAAVLDGVGSDSTAILVGLDAGPMGMYFAATKPERTSALILFNTTARYLAADDYPIGMPREVAEVLLGQLDQLWATAGLRRSVVMSVHPNLIPRVARGRRGSRAWRRSAAARLTGPAWLSTPMTRLCRQAMTLGPAPVRTWEVSSAKVTSRRWCSASIARCPRSRSASLAGLACSNERLVMA
jgi:pimeloyl-ACP methyl ester carboxylesterase